MQPAESGAGLEALDLHKSFGPTRALDGISFDVRAGEILAVLGPSGCGKSTLLHVIAGLEVQDAGSLRWGGLSIDGIPPHRRDFGLMFQDFALFPHMNVFENVAFGLRMKALEDRAMRARVEEMLRLVRLPGFGERDVDTLSGGERQRVALARSLAPRPRLLMLDEPLGDLDRALREELLLELPPLLGGMQQTSIYVTHDQEEAFAIAGRVVVMNAGRAAQIGRPDEIYRNPASLFVARFLGLSNLLEGEALEGESVVRTPVGDFPLPAGASGQVTLLLRPDRVRLGPGGRFSLQGTIVERSFRGSLQRVVVAVRGTPLTFDFHSSDPVPQEGAPIELSFDPQEALQALPR